MTFGILDRFRLLIPDIQVNDLEAKVVILEAQAQSHEGHWCQCGCRATSELSYAEEMQGQQNASPASSSPPIDQSYQTLPTGQVMELVPVPEDIQLLSPNSSEEEVLWVPPPRTPTSGRQVGGQHCWTRHKTDKSGAGAA